ncbi:MAG: hypothetical protein RQ751_05020 [Longimicrobiales bacterium]|nr:hypothetical protein [Longimicrobiales bacterium]
MPTPRGRLPALLLAALATCPLSVPLNAQVPADSGPDRTQASGETVSLRFAWPPGITADVVSETSRVRGDEVLHALRITSVMEVLEGEDGGLVIQYRDSELVEPDAAPAAVEDPATRFMRALAEQDLDYRVGGDGELLGIGNLDRIREVMERELGQMLHQLDSLVAEDGADGSVREVAANLRGMMDQALSEETLAQGFAEQWSGMVGFWVDADLDLGVTYTVSSREASPLIPGLILPMEMEFGVEERVPCHADAAPDSCVLLSILSIPDPEVAGGAVGERLRGLFGATVDFRILTFTQESEMRVVAEPATLLTHSFSLVSRMGIELEVDGAVQAERQVDESSMILRYRR